MWNRTPWWREAANDRAGALEPLHLALPPPRSRGEEQAARVAATFRPLQERRDARRRHFAPTRDCPGWNREASRDDVSLARFWGSRARKLSMTRATRPQPRWLQTAITITSPMQILLRHPFASGPSGRAGRPEMAARGKAQPRGKEAASLHERADLQGDRRSESAADLRRLVSSLHGLDRRQLLLQWRNHLGGTPPAHLPSWLLTRVLAYRLQPAAFGDLEPGLLRRLKSAGDAATKIEPAPFANRPPATRDGVDLRPGAMLAREWRGKLERVTVLEDGYAWNGKTYGSLSVIAKAITGTSWNGHRFFGLRSGRKSPARMTARAARSVAFRPSGAAL